jgi:hypothetical protein
MSQQHTPGPWEWELSADAEGAETITILGADGAPIFRRAYFSRGDDENGANANMLTTAPELYAALRVTSAALQAIALNGLVAEDAKVKVKGDETALTIGEILNAADLILGRARDKSEAAPPASV